MRRQSCITPDGLVTIPRAILKSLEIEWGNDLLIDVEDGVLVIKKVKHKIEESEERRICKAG